MLLTFTKRFVLLPVDFLNALEGIKGFDRKALEAVHQSGNQVTSVRINPAKLSMVNEAWSNIHHSRLTILQPVPWSSYGFYLSKRPSFTFDPFFHAGCYYVQEASSMFLEQALKQTVDLLQPLNVLDLCAAPGGKSTHLQSLLSPNSLLVSNEVIKSRAAILRQNIIKWGSANVVVTNNDPQHFGRLAGFFDVMVVDAPCSGSGLFRKDADAVQEWSAEAVQLCCGRQKRILADALAALKENGVLIYATCSYSREEDEDIADWLVAEGNMQSLPLDIPAAWGVVETESPVHNAKGYRFFPDKVKGEGFFLACFRKAAGTGKAKYKIAKPQKASRQEQEVAKEWLKENDLELYKEHVLYALPTALSESYSVIKNNLYVQYAGIAIGDVLKNKLIPDHALALSPFISDAVQRFPVDRETAIRFLQKKELQVEPNVKGWQIISYEEQSLGWINALSNRINNYYPKEFRILKESDDSDFEK